MATRHDVTVETLIAGDRARLDCARLNTIDYDNLRTIDSTHQFDVSRQRERRQSTVVTRGLANSEHETAPDEPWQRRDNDSAHRV